MNDLSVLMHDVLAAIHFDLWRHVNGFSFYNLGGYFGECYFYEFFREENRVLYLFKVV